MYHSRAHVGPPLCFARHYGVRHGDVRPDLRSKLPGADPPGRLKRVTRPGPTRAAVQETLQDLRIQRGEGAFSQGGHMSFIASSERPVGLSVSCGADPA